MKRILTLFSIFILVISCENEIDIKKLDNEISDKLLSEINWNDKELWTKIENTFFNYLKQTGYFTSNVECRFAPCSSL